MSAEIINFVRRPGRTSSTAPETAAPTAGFRSIHSPTVFTLPFVTLPEQPCTDWRTFWQETEMWNVTPSRRPHEDFQLGRQYARQTIDAIKQDESSDRPLDQIVSRMIERAFTRRGPGGRLCRQLDATVQGFIREVCKAALSRGARS
jgi:hypothetical protein